VARGTPVTREAPERNDIKTDHNKNMTSVTGINATFGHDLLASVVVFLVALPLCMGISIASGVPPTAGIITGIVGGIVVSALAGSPLQVSGPAAGLSVLVLQRVQQHGMEMLGVMVLVDGLLQFAAGIFRLGQWLRTNWDRQHHATGGALAIEWDELSDKFHQHRARGSGVNSAPVVDTP
jgi:hypothetical protein